MVEKESRPSRLPVLLAMLFFLVVVLYFSPFGGAERPTVGEQAPDLSRFPVEGTLPETTNRVVLLDFWASWCGPCEISIPVVQEMHKLYASRGLVVIGISVDQDVEGMNRFMRKHPVTFPNVRDRFGHLQEAFNASSLPRSFVIGADGKIVGAHAGFNPSKTREDYIQEIESALKAAGK
jgi:thiol-disulfide isomerase/thioredoxin